MDRFLGNRRVKHLLSLPNVVGVGYGYKETAGVVTGQKGIVVLVEQKLPAQQLAKNDLVPRHIGGMVSDVLEVGQIYAWGRHPKAKNTISEKTDDNPRRTRWRPAPGGVSIGHYQITSGTLGAVVFDRTSGERLILSNNHILANATNGRDGRANPGDPILQPGRSAGGTVEMDTIARLQRFVPIKRNGVNVVDAAVAKPLEPALVSGDILEVGRVDGIVKPELGMRIKKSGLTSGLTTDTIRLVRMIIMVNYGGSILRFRDQIMAGAFSQAGDSGSLVLNDNNAAVGLLFGGSPLFTVINPITRVLDLLDVQFSPPSAKRRRLFR